MSFRMSVRLADSDEEFGNDHKFYGYFSYEQVKSSFDILYPFMAYQWDGYDYNDWDEPAKEAYELMHLMSSTDDLEIGPDTFAEFAWRYIKDMTNAGKDDVYIDAAKKYLGTLCVEPGNKVLSWC